MFCKNCGNEMKDDATFCTNCGTAIGQVQNTTNEINDRRKEDNEIRIEIKPMFIWGYQIIKKLLETLMYTVIIMLFFLDFEDASFEFILGAAVVVGIIVLIVNIIRLFIEKAQYKRASYRFLKTKVEYEDSFLNKEEKQVKYEHVREVVKTQNILERIFGVGKIILYTNASSGVPNTRLHSQMGRNGIYIHCVKDLDENFLKVKECIDAIDE